MLRGSVFNVWKRGYLRIFKGNRGLRAGWQFIAFFLLTIVFVAGLEFLAGPPLSRLFHVDENSLNSGAILVSEILLTTGVLAATWVVATFEGRRIDSYGLPIREAFRARFWEGTFLGIAAACLVAGGMYLMGSFQIHGFALQGINWFAQPILWSVAMLLVGIGEELLLRGYGFQTLAVGLGFWPATAITSLIFGALHLNKPGENFIDIFNIIALGVLMCVAVWRTGNIWLAVGFHFSFDLMQFFVIGTRNGGRQPAGTLLQSTFPGPSWINGGPLGTEASYFMLPVIAGLYLYLILRFPASTGLWYIAPEKQSPEGRIAP